MFDVRRLRLLHGLATHGTVSATADALRLTGPAVSQQLAALEREAGVPLLAKRGRTLELTDAGRLLVSHAEVILGDLAAAEADLARLSNTSTGTVRLAAFPSAARTLVASIWSTMDEAVELRLLEMEPERSIEALRRQQVDIAVAHSYSLLPRDLPAGLEQHPLMSDPVMLVVPEDRGIEPGGVVDLADFSGDRWLVPDRGVSCYEMTRRACGAAGFVPTVVAEATDFSVLVALVAAGAGVALVPGLALPDQISHQVPDRAAPVSLHSLADPVSRHIFALTRAGTARLPAIRVVLDALGSG